MFDFDPNIYNILLSENILKLGESHWYLLYDKS